MTTPAFYGTSTVKKRRSKSQLEQLDDALISIAHEERPLTIRGLFYRAMSQGEVPKTENGYRQVQRRALALRRSGELPYHWIADGTRWQVKPTTHGSMERALSNAASSYRRALWDEQEVHVELWVEKDAITSVVRPVTEEWDVPIMVARGYSSESFLWSTAQALIADGRPAVIYQLGDHDPSGVDAWRHIKSKLNDFAEGVDLTFRRLAVTPAQVEEYSLPTRPTKASDSRSRNFEGDSIEVDAVPSPILRSIVQDAIEEHIDYEQLRLTRIAEDSERSILHSIAGQNWRLGR